MALASLLISDYGFRVAGKEGLATHSGWAPSL
jgi:hypothetical protein